MDNTATMTVQTTDSVRQQRELDTAKAMIRLYCKTLHRGAIVCPECEGLINYVESRIGSCRLGNDKPNCLQCQTQCYQPAKRLHLKHVLRWAKPKFTWRRPLQAFKFKIGMLRRSTNVDSTTPLQ
ncbi:nitrous oxide-stimulated promoter family protein [Photobacterium minamisatsumaniensis]|uniref:nitrous oxide-stimulated promoter family protein n=1 Tax=Photobacterium minamisatsumaniensis TaxID=2910233 RepID=UPI003D121F1A